MVSQDEYIYSFGDNQTVDVLSKKDLSLIGNLKFDSDILCISSCLCIGNEYVVAWNSHDLFIFNMAGNFNKMS